MEWKENLNAYDFGNMTEYTVTIIVGAPEPLGATSVITYFLKFHCEVLIYLIYPKNFRMI